VGFPTPCYHVGTFFSPRATCLSHGFYLVWRLGSLAKILCGGIPVSVITLMTLIYWVLFYGAFWLGLRLGGSLQPKVLVLETLAAEFIFDVPFIIRWVNICFLYVREIFGWMRNNRSVMQQWYKVPDLGQNFLQLHVWSAENPNNFCGKRNSS